MLALRTALARMLETPRGPHAHGRAPRPCAAPAPPCGPAVLTALERVDELATGVAGAVAHVEASTTLVGDAVGDRAVGEELAASGGGDTSSPASTTSPGSPGS